MSKKFETKEEFLSLLVNEIKREWPKTQNKIWTQFESKGRSVYSDAINGFYKDYTQKKYKRTMDLLNGVLSGIYFEDINNEYTFGVDSSYVPDHHAQSKHSEDYQYQIVSGALIFDEAWSGYHGPTFLNIKTEAPKDIVNSQLPSLYKEIETKEKKKYIDGIIKQLI